MLEIRTTFPRVFAFISTENSQTMDPTKCNDAIRAAVARVAGNLRLTRQLCDLLMRVGRDDRGPQEASQIGTLRFPIGTA